MFTRKDLVKLIIPLMIEQLLIVAVGMADTIMISSVGEAAVSGVSLVDTVNVLIINVFAALSTGGAVVAGQYLGQKNREKASNSANQLILFSFAASLVFMILVLAGQKFILEVVFGRLESDVLENARIYLLITSFSIPFIAVYNAGAALFRTMSNSKISMITSLAMNAINITGNAVLIFGFGMGVAGAAIPTLISRIVAAVIMIVLLTNEKRDIHINRHFSFRFQKGVIKKICYIGIPNSLENSMFQLGKIIVLSLVASFGTTAMAANAVANNIAMFQILPGMAVGLAVVTVVSRCVGAGDYGQVKHYTKVLMGITYGAIIGLNIIVIFLCPFVIKAYHLSPETGALTEQILIYHAVCCMIIWPASFTLPNALRASNDVKFTMIVSIASMWVFRIAFSYLLGKVLGFGVFGIWVAMTIDWLFRAVCFVIRFVRGRWQTLNKLL